MTLLASCASEEPKVDRAGADTTTSDPGRRDSVVIELVGVDSSSVLDLLVSAHQVDYRPSLAGAFVTAIDSVENSDNCFWLYSVNDSMARVASDNYITRDGDRVKWHFRRMGD